jgi:hypothetical protein
VTFWSAPTCQRFPFVLPFALAALFTFETKSWTDAKAATRRRNPK